MCYCCQPSHFPEEQSARKKGRKSVSMATNVEMDIKVGGIHNFTPHKSTLFSLLLTINGQSKLIAEFHAMKDDAFCHKNVNLSFCSPGG